MAVAEIESSSVGTSQTPVPAAVRQTHDQIGRLATNAYIMGSGFTDLDSLLKADGPQDLMDRMAMLDSLGKNNKTALTRYKSAEAVAQDAKEEADATQLQQEIATAKVEETKKEAEAAEAEQQKEVDKLQKVQDELAKE